jgi:hypothetical protein
MTTKDNTYRPYLWRLAVTMTGALAVVASFNWWVDPYRLFHQDPRPAIVETKARPAGNVGDVKRLNAVSFRPNELILGNSRAEIGFDPQHPAWAKRGERAYNLAVPGQNIPEVRDSFVLLVEGGQIRTAILAVDFQDFIQNAGKIETGVEPGRPVDLRRIRLREQGRSLLTLTGTGDSIKTLRASRLPFPETNRPDGFNPLLEYFTIVQREGYDSLFRQRLNETTANYVRARKGLYPEGESDSLEFAALRDILRLAREQQIKLYVVTYPYYGQYYLLFDQLGLWGEFEEWKRLVVRAIDETNRTGAGPPIEFWDFAAVSRLTKLPLLSTDSSGASAWYLEGGHFKKELGDVMLPQFLLSDEPVTEDLRTGTRLTSENIEHWLAEQRTQLQLLAEQNSAMDDAVQAAVDRAVQAQRR